MSNVEVVPFSLYEQKIQVARAKREIARYKIAPSLVVVAAARALTEPITKRNRMAEKALEKKTAKEVRACRLAAVADARSFIKDNGLIELFGLKKKDGCLLRFLEGRVAENILFSRACLPSRKNRLGNLLGKENSTDETPIIGTVFETQEKLNKRILNRRRDIREPAERISFYIADLFYLLREDALINHTAFSLSVSEERMIYWRKRWNNFPDITSSPKQQLQGNK